MIWDSHLGHYHRFLLRNADTKAKIAVIEATCTQHAITRIQQLIHAAALREENIELEAMYPQTAIEALPIFNNGYFAFLKDTQHN